MDRKIFKQEFTKNCPPEWICPTCGKSVLRIKPGTFHSDEVASSRDHSYEYWGPEFKRYVYSCLLHCINDKCEEVVSSTGVGECREIIEREYERGPLKQGYRDFFRPNYFDPPLRIIQIPEECPQTVVEPIEESFRFVLSSPSSAANTIRIAVEELLTNLKVKRFKIVKRKRQGMSLHARIKLLPKKHEAIRDSLFAIKWLGNAGSHSLSNISFDDVMDAYEFLDHILQEVYAKKSEKLKAKVQAVNKKRGPKK